MFTSFCKKYNVVKGANFYIGATVFNSVCMFIHGRERKRKR